MRLTWLLAWLAVPAIGASVVVAPAPAIAATGDNVAAWSREIAVAAERSELPRLWIERVMQAESRGRTMLNGRPITSSAGAMGLMQLMPGTWREMRLKWRLGSDPHFPPDNIIAGAAYLREMYDRFGYPGLFGAYNAGPGRYEASLRSGRPLPAETRGYLVQVAGTHAPVSEPSPRSMAPPIFVAVNTHQRFELMAKGLEHEVAVPVSESVAGRPDPLFVFRTAD